jgi:hypothetical protein
LADRIYTSCDDYSHVQSQGLGCNHTAIRVSFSLAELRSANLSERLRLDPLRHLRALEAACHIIADEGRPGYDVKAGMMSFLWPCVVFAYFLPQIVCFLVHQGVN